MNVRQAIRITIDKHGVEILNIPLKFQAMVADYAEGYDQEVRIFAKCCRKDILSLARKIVLIRDESKIEMIAIKMREILEKDFMAAEHAITGINIILQGLDVDFVLKKECIDENNFQDIGMHVDLSEKESIHSKNEMLQEFDNIVDKKIVRDLRNAADNGDINAMITLGIFYEGGIMVEENWRLADYYFCQAAENGSREAN